MDIVRYKVVLAYDGTAFSGMQRQDNGRSVQGEVEAALRPLGWTGKAILAAGRTDAGVHARGQVIAFDLAWKHGPEGLLKALNAGLPADVAACEASVTPADFHPRFEARARTYEYRLFCQPQRDPLRERYAWRAWPPVKLGRLQAAAKMLRGEHDFAAFGSPPKTGGKTVRKVTRAAWRKTGDDEFVFDVRANAFLYHMVRRMVGLQVKVGQGAAEVADVGRAVSTPAGKVRELAPPQGLYLVAVEY
ncbi:MAG: tRNA pseudouridine(38-40) synthase TruA [Anaerolineales bacterium]